MFSAAADASLQIKVYNIFIFIDILICHVICLPLSDHITFIYSATGPMPFTQVESTSNWTIQLHHLSQVFVSFCMTP